MFITSKQEENSFFIDKKISIITVILLSSLLVIKNAWISDDAMITFRTVINAVDGYGFTWNIDERVQSYTHPLWMLLLTGAYSLTHEIYITSTVLSILCLVGFIIIMGLGLARSQIAFLAASIGFIFAKSFIDYSSSGLENPLSHLLVVAFCVSYLRYFTKYPWLTTLFASLAMLCRVDFLFLLGPAMVFAVVNQNWHVVEKEMKVVKGYWPKIRLLPRLIDVRLIGLMLLGMLPLVIWEIFSLIYYGFLVPNTAYAKLNTGIPQNELYIQGAIYLVSSIRNDPVTLLVTVIGFFAPFIVRHWRASALSFGIGLYLLYVIHIGGDFMSGRFLTSPLIVAASLIAFNMRSRMAFLLVIIISVIGVSNPRGPLAPDTTAYLQQYTDSNLNSRELQGVMDERAFYFPRRNLVALARNPESTEDFSFQYGRRTSIQVVTEAFAIGMYGLAVGPETHVVDLFALSDPLLARLPAVYNPNWRIGHFVRFIPDGYFETLERGENLIHDENLALYYDKLNLIIRGPLFSAERWDAIINMNLGAYDYLVDTDYYRYPDQIQYTYNEIMEMDTIPETISLPVGGVLIDMNEGKFPRCIDISVSQERSVRIELLHKGEVVYKEDVLGVFNPLRSFNLITFDVPDTVSDYDHIRILPLNDGETYIDRIRFVDNDDYKIPDFRLGASWDIHDQQLVASSPASIYITSEKAQPYWLDILPLAVYDPNTSDKRGSHGTLILRTSAGYTTTVQLDSNVPVTIPFATPSGSQWVELSLEAGTHQSTSYLGFGSSDFTFSFQHVRIRTLDEVDLPKDILIDGFNQYERPNDMMVWFDDGWYQYEPEVNVRWASPTGGLSIYSPTGGKVKLKITLRYISDGTAPSDAGILTVMTNDQLGSASQVWTWQPFVADIDLQEGWNQVELQLHAPPFQPWGSPKRDLSFAVSQVELLTQP